jgi:hypothetical protein
MADFLTRLTGRTLGMAPVVQPLIAPRFASEVIAQPPDPEWDGEASGGFEGEAPSSSRAFSPRSVMAERPGDPVIDRWENRGVPTESGPARREVVAPPTSDSPPPETRVRGDVPDRALPPPADHTRGVEEDLASAAQASQRAQEGNHETRANPLGQTELTPNTTAEAPHSATGSWLGPTYPPHSGSARREVVAPPTPDSPPPEPPPEPHSEEDVTGSTPQSSPSGPRSTKKVPGPTARVGPLVEQRSDTNPQTTYVKEARPTVDVTKRRPDEAGVARPRDQEDLAPITPSRTLRTTIPESKHTSQPDLGLYDKSTSLPESSSGSPDSPHSSGDIADRPVPRLTDTLVEPEKRVSLSPQVASAEQAERPRLETYPVTSAASDLLRVAPGMERPEVDAWAERDSPEPSPPTIRVNIGRVEVRAAMPPPPAPPRQQAAAPKKLSLDEYLRSRSSEGQR